MPEKTLKYAILDAINRLRGHHPWMGGAVIVRSQSDQHLFVAIPGAYLTDISYTGSRHKVVQYNDIYELITEGDPNEYTDDDIEALADYLLEFVQQAADEELETE